MTRWQAAVVVVLLAVVSPGAGAEEFFVSPRGDDAADGSQARPWRTAARAVQAAGPGVTINLREGAYHEAVVIQKGGAEGQPFILQGAEGERAVLDGDFKRKIAVTVEAPHVTVRGIGIRNYLQDGMYLRGPKAHHILIERNVIHHISNFLKGEGDATRGIRAMAVSDCTIRGNTLYFIVGHNECFGILFDVRSAFKTAIRNTIIERNLFYFIDKSAVRVVDNTVGADKRCHVLADPVHVRRNIVVHNAYVGIEVNTVNTSVTEGVGPLAGREGAPVLVEDNFVGWNGSFGLNPKQSARGVSRHNTIYRTSGYGYYQSGGPSVGMRIEGNLIVDNPVGTAVHAVGTDNVFVGNYYRQRAPWLDFFWDRTRGWGTTWTDVAELRKDSELHPEQKGVLNNDAKLFRDPGKGDFRLLVGCPAAGKAPDGQDFGTRASELTGVGASGKYGLANVPLLPEITGLRVVSASSEDPNPGPRLDAYYPSSTKSLDMKEVAAGHARHLIDGALYTVWRPAGDATAGWVVLELPEPTRIGAFMILASHTAYLQEFKRHVREFKLHVRASEAEPWRDLGKYTRYRREEGRVFPIGFFSPEGPPTAKQVKLEVLSNHGAPILEVAEFRLYRAFEPFE